MVLVIPVKPKSNNTPGSAPTTASIGTGELGLNTNDGVLYTNISVSGVNSIVVLGGPISFSGDATGSGRPGAAVALTLKNTGTAGTYTKVTTDAQGRVSSGTALGSSDVTTALGFTPINATTLGAANGTATLDGGGKLSSGQIPASLIGNLNYQGTWNASTNTPTLTSGTGTKGFMYKVATAGTTTLDGNSHWSVNDQLIFDGSVWDKIDGQDTEVLSVAGKVGTVTLATTDLTDVAAGTPGSGNILIYTAGKWTATAPSAPGTGTVTSVSSADGAITVSSPSTTPVLQFNPGTISLSAIGGSLTASQLAPAGTNGYILQTVAGAAAWTAISALGILGSVTPLIDGTAAIGTAATAARSDHVHPTDTSRAPISSPTFTGTPALTTTPSVNDSTTKLASTAFVVGQAGAATPLINGTAATGTSLQYSRQDHVHPTDTTRAPLASPTFTGTVTIPSGASISGFAPLLSPALTGTPVAPTAAASTNTTQLATCAFVVGQAGSATPLIDGTAAVGTSLLYSRQDHVHPTDTTRAPLNSPSLTGSPASITPGTTDNSTAIATTAFVNNLLATVTGGSY